VITSSYNVQQAQYWYGVQALPLTTLCREEPKHSNNNVCSRIITGTAWYHRWCQEEPKHRDKLRVLYRFMERFGAFEHTKSFRKEEEQSKRKIKKKHVLLDFSLNFSQ
jgi:hypothetical protein